MGGHKHAASGNAAAYRINIKGNIIAEYKCFRERNRVSGSMLRVLQRL